MSIIINNISSKHANSHYNFLLLSLGFHVFVKLYHFTGSVRRKSACYSIIRWTKTLLSIKNGCVQCLFSVTQAITSIVWSSTSWTHRVKEISLGCLVFFFLQFSPPVIQLPGAIYSTDKDAHLYFLKITSVVKPHPSKEPPPNTPSTPRPPPPSYICTINYHCIGASIKTPVHKFKPGSRAALTQCGFSVRCARRDRRDWRESMFHKDT